MIMLDDGDKSVIKLEQQTFQDYYLRSDRKQCTGAFLFTVCLSWKHLVTVWYLSHWSSVVSCVVFHYLPCIGKFDILYSVIFWRCKWLIGLRRAAFFMPANVIKASKHTWIANKSFYEIKLQFCSLYLLIVCWGKKQIKIKKKTLVPRCLISTEQKWLIGLVGHLLKP